MIEQNEYRQKKPGENAKAQEVTVLHPSRDPLASCHGKFHAVLTAS
jgi:hypothetical protein